MSFNYSPKIITDGLVAYYDVMNTRSYPTSGDVWYDLKNANNGTINPGGVSYDSSNGGSLFFDGSNADYITLLDTNLRTLFDNTSKTHFISFWLKNTTKPAPSNVQILFNVYNTGYNGGRTFGFYNNAGSTQIFANMFYSVSDFASIEVYCEEFFDTIMNIGFKWNGVGYIVYINGIEQVPLTQTVITAGPYSLNDNPINIGADSSIVGNPHFTGYLYQVSFYDRELSNDEIIRNFNALKGRYNL